MRRMKRTVFSKTSSNQSRNDSGYFFLIQHDFVNISFNRYEQFCARMTVNIIKGDNYGELFACTLFKVANNK